MKIIRITATWCPACLITNKHWNKINKDGEIEFVDYDYDFDEELVDQYQVSDILPVAIAIKDGKEIARLIGEKNEKEIREFIANIN